MEMTNRVHFESNCTNNFVLTLSNDFMEVDLNQTAYIFNKPFLHCFNQCFFSVFLIASSSISVKQVIVFIKVLAVSRLCEIR